MIKNFVHSTVFKIAALMFLVSFLAVASMFSSVFISDGAQNDAAAVNVAGSLRMQSYRLLSLAQVENKSEQEIKRLQELIKHFENDLTSGVLVNKQALIGSARSRELLEGITESWLTNIKPSIQSNFDSLSNDSRGLIVDIDNFVNEVELLVEYFQKHAEKNIATIRLIQSLALFCTLLLIAFAMMIVNRHIEKPLSRLTAVAKQIGRGDFTARADETGHDELALLGRTFNKMSASMYRSQNQLEEQIVRKTKKLSRSNESLDILFTLSRKLNVVDAMNYDFQPILDRLAEVTKIKDMDLCIMTAQGQGPYEHLVSTKKDLPEKCIKHQCSGCTEHDKVFPESDNKIRYQLSQGDENYGVFSVTPSESNPLEDWQHQLFEAVAEQIANALSMKHQLEQSRRIALMNERTVIARELHDSLAQALSYLKIQVTRLQKLQRKENAQAQIEEVIDELKNGLGAAYSELRELLTTFRLKLDGHGIKAALEQTIKQLQTRNDNFEFELKYEVDNIPFTPQEEIHLLQIAREAMQNAFYHSKGSKIKVSLTNSNINEVVLTIKDNGIGIPQDPNKLNHYGLAIMQERSRSLTGELDVSLATKGGTIVKFAFFPEYAKLAELKVH